MIGQREIYVRAAIAGDNQALQDLQAQCPMGASLIVSAVNTPDFFARAKAYERYQVFVACYNDRIIGSAAAAIREAMINGDQRRIGYEFQYFTSPDYRKQGVAEMLHRRIEDYFNNERIVHTFLVIMEGNTPSIRFFERQGFKLYRTLAMPTVFSYRTVEVPPVGQVRPITPEDMADVAELLNETWKGYDFYEPHTPQSLGCFIDRTPAFTYNDFVVLENRNKIFACVGAWDWSQITKLNVKALSFRLKMINFLMDFVSHFRPMPRPVKPGTTLRQWGLTLLGFKAPEYLAALIRHLNNVATQKEIDQILCVCERDHEILHALKGLFHVNVGIHLYVKPFDTEWNAKNRVFLNGIDL
jgi:GNAT superfamily N-acetyltransferase